MMLKMRGTRSAILVFVGLCRPGDQNSLISLCQVFKHIFTSPSSAEEESKATRSGNARIHGMTQVTSASIAYVATQAGPSPFQDFTALAESHHYIMFIGLF